MDDEDDEEGDGKSVGRSGGGARRQRNLSWY